MNSSGTAEIFSCTYLAENINAKKIIAVKDNFRSCEKKG